MKTKLFSLLAALLLCLTCALFASCASSGDGGNNGGNTPPQNNGGTSQGGSEVEDHIFDLSTQMNIVVDEDGLSTATELIRAALYSKLENPPYILSSQYADKQLEHEIVIGRTDREISEKAYRALDRFEPDGMTSETKRFVIYSDGKSVAIAFDEVEDNLIADTACKYFVESYLGEDTETLTLKAGTVYAGHTTVYDLYAARDAEEAEAAWLNLSMYVNEDVYNALREYYKMFNPDIVTWLANLYDPDIGGFYYSNSARNTQGYLPDVESTRQALDFIVQSGMLPKGESIGMAMPKDIQAQIVRFVKGLQDPNDGYFYHPQWGQTIGTSRRSRDLGWSTGILNYFGAKPTYNTPNGYEGDGILADGTPVGGVESASFLTSRFAITKAQAVSKLVSTSTVVATSVASEAYDSVANFRRYLDNFETSSSYVHPESGLGGIRYRSYVIGNELTAQYGVINEQDKILYEKEGVSIKRILFDWLNENQNPETGMWDWTPTDSPYYDAYEGVNGLLKICTLYYFCGEPMPMCEKAIKGAIDSITCTVEPVHTCCTYNTWFAINYCFKIMRELNHEGYAADAIQTELRANSAAAILATRDKLAKNQKKDGSFSYYPGHSAHFSQNAPVCVPYTDEGDVNASVIAFTHTADQMFSVLGISAPKKLGSADWYRFITTITSLDGVIKDVVPYEEPEIVSSKNRGSGLYVNKAISYSNTTIAELDEAGRLGNNALNDGRKENTFIYDDVGALNNVSITKPKGNPALEYTITADGDPYVYFYTDKRTVDDNTDSYVFETDMLYISGDCPDANNEKAAFTFYAFSAAKGSTVDHWYPSAVSLFSTDQYGVYSLQSNGEEFAEIREGVWYTFRMEIDNVRDAEATVRLYLNNELLHTHTGAGYKNAISAIGFRYAWATNNGRFFADNTYCSAISEDGSEYVDTNTYHNVPDYLPGGGVYYDKAEHFDGTSAELVESGFMSSHDTGKGHINFEKPEGAFWAIAQDGVLDYSNAGSGDPFLFIKNKNGVGQNTTCDTYVFETDVNFKNYELPSGGGGYFMIYAVTDVSKGSLWHAAAWQISMNADGKYYFFAGSDDTSRVLIDFDRWYNIRIEIANVRSGQAKVNTYVNGVLIESATIAGGFFDVEAMGMRYSWSENKGQALFDNMIFTSIDESSAPEQGDSARGTGVYYDKAERYDLEELDLIEKGYGSIKDLDYEVVFGGTSGHTANVITVGGDKALEFASGATHSPYLYINNSVKGSTTGADDSYIFETDLRFEALSTPSSSGAYFELYPSKGEGVANHLWGGTSIYLKKDADGKYYFTSEGDGETKKAIELCTWYNLRIEIDDIKGNATMKVYINNEIIVNKNVTSAEVEIDSFIMRFSWSEKAGMVLLDNTYFANFTEEGDEVDTAAPPTENVTLSGNLGTGAFASSGLNFSDVTLDGLKEEGRLSSLGTGVADVTFGASGVAYAQIVSIANNTALKFGSTANGDPMFFIKPENKYTEADKDSYVLDMDFAYGGGTLVSGSDAETAVGGITFNAKPGTKYSILNLTIMYNNQTGKHRLNIAQGYNFGPADAVTSYDINLKEWYNIRVTITDTTDAVNKGTVTVAINGETVLTYQLTNPLTSIGAYDGLDVGLYHRWGCNNSVMYLDNIYFSMVADADVPESEEPDTPDTPEVPVVPELNVSFAGERGKGVYYEKALKYEGVTATELNAAKLLESTTDTNEKYNFDAPNMINPVMVKKLNGDSALEIIKNNNHDPELLVRNEAKGFAVNADSDDFVVELDICFDNLTRGQAGNSGTTLFWMTVDKGYSGSTNPAYRIPGFTVMQTSASEGEPYFAFGVGKVADFAFDTWYNIRIEYRDISTDSGTCTMFINNVQVGTVGVSTQFSLESIASVELFNSWSETNGKVYIDNFYLGAIKSEE